ncbi:hypothetical protein C0992_003355 [Termitomyces sp. T32_za158]|nr:hypothetical protein C0992_003355 [Termitomyces sp. T32_za158]
MRFALAILALAASVSAQTIPSCANACLFGTNVDLDGCQPTDNVCLCKSQAFVSKSTTCIEAACKGNDLDNALSVARTLCASVGVTLTSTFPVSATASPSATAAADASAPATTSNAATLHRASANALAGLAAAGLAALAL